MYTDTHIQIYKDTQIQRHTYTTTEINNIYTCTNIRIDTSTDIRIYTYTHTETTKSTCIHIQKETNPQTDQRIYPGIPLYKYIYIHTYKDTHKHMQ